MGKEQSKEESPEPAAQTVNAAEVDSSSGFHILEIHTATSIFGVGFTLFAIFMVILVWYLIRRCRRNPYHLPSFYNPTTSHHPALPSLPNPAALPMPPSHVHPYYPPERVVYACRPPPRRHPREDRFEEVEEPFDEQ